MVLQNFFQGLLTTNTKNRTANAAAASRSSADLKTTEEQLTTIEGDNKSDRYCSRVFLNMPDFTSSTELEYITWKAVATYIVNKLQQDTVSCCTKLLHGEGQVEIGRWLARFPSTTMPLMVMGSFCRAWKNSATLLVKFRVPLGFAVLEIG